MPRKSLRQKTLDIVRAQLSRLKNDFLLRLVMNIDDPIEDDHYISKKIDCLIWSHLVTCIDVAITDKSEDHLT